MNNSLQKGLSLYRDNQQRKDITQPLNKKDYGISDK